MQTIGRIKLVQVQRASLKVNEDDPQNSAYSPAPLLPVEQLLLTQKGVLGLAADGATFVDVHNSDHLRARRGGGISVGFTSHYESLRARFGPHLHDGIAGENIIIETEQAFTEDNLGLQVAIQTAQKTHYLKVEKVIVPCVEFSRFCLPESTAEQIKETLQFLNQGRRGYIIQVEEEFVVQAGDRFLAEVL